MSRDFGIFMPNIIFTHYTHITHTYIYNRLISVHTDISLFFLIPPDTNSRPKSDHLQLRAADIHSYTQIVMLIYYAFVKTVKKNLNRLIVPAVIKDLLVSDMIYLIISIKTADFI